MKDQMNVQYEKCVTCVHVIGQLKWLKILYDLTLYPLNLDLKDKSGGILHFCYC